VLSSATTCLWKSFRRSRTGFRDRAETVRLHLGTGVHLHPGILFGIIPEHCSESSRNRVHLAPDSPPGRVNLWLRPAERDPLGNAPSTPGFLPAKVGRCIITCQNNARRSAVRKRPGILIPVARALVMLPMKDPVCPYCQVKFTPSRYRPDQRVCSSRPCQLRRQADYHQAKIQQDPAYRAQCSDSRRKWRDEHPDYMRNYRARNNAPSIIQPPLLSKLSTPFVFNTVDNGIPFDVRESSARLVFCCATERVRNTLASAQVIVIEKLVVTSLTDRRRKEHLLGVVPRTTV
jgi:hypothetical protein